MEGGLECVEMMKPRVEHRRKRDHKDRSTHPSSSILSRNSITCTSTRLFRSCSKIP